MDKEKKLLAASTLMLLSGIFAAYNGYTLLSEDKKTNEVKGMLPTGDEIEAREKFNKAKPKYINNMVIGIGLVAIGSFIYNRIETKK